MITANYSELLAQASGTSDTYLRRAIESVDDALGNGYAAKHPELLAAVVASSTADFNAACIAIAIQEATESISSALRALRGAPELSFEYLVHGEQP